MIVALVLWDVFEVVVLPRRVQRTVRPARYFFRGTWRAWSNAATRVRGTELRENLLSFYGPLSLLTLFAAWAGALIFGYGLIHLAATAGGREHLGFGTALYYSGTTFFTLGLGDIAPRSGFPRAVSVLEAANGFGFLALVISYLPVFYQSFSRRETSISLLDARAGSPPTAGELLRRYADNSAPPLGVLLSEWERWAAELLESHLSYAVLMFFRSQHERQSWVAALAAMLDTSAMVITRGSEADAYAATLTFAMARHAAVDLSDVFERAPRALVDDRLPPDDFLRLRAMTAAHPRLSDADADGAELSALRATYEPYVSALSRYLLMPLPGWLPARDAVDAWQTSRVEPASAGVADPIAGRPGRRR